MQRENSPETLPAVGLDRLLRITQRSGDAALRPLDAQEEWRSVCGFRRDLVQGREDFAVSVHHIRIEGSRTHRHHRATEFCIGMGGRGAIVVEGKPLPIGPGDVVTVPPMHWHTYESDPADPLRLMIIANPGIRPDAPDIEFKDATDDAQSLGY